jgi:hypothetical protein
MTDLETLKKSLLAKLNDGSEEEIIGILNSKITNDSGEETILLNNDLHYLELFDGDEWLYLIRLLKKGYLKALNLIVENFSQHRFEPCVLGTLYGACEGLDWEENPYISYHIAKEHEVSCVVKNVNFAHLPLREFAGQIVVEIESDALNFGDFSIEESQEVSESDFNGFTKDTNKVSIVMPS